MNTNFNISFNIALKNVKSHWRKSMAAILAVSLGLVAQTLFIGYLDNVESLFISVSRDKEMLGHILIENKNRLDPLKKND